MTDGYGQLQAAAGYVKGARIAGAIKTPPPDATTARNAMPREEVAAIPFASGVQVALAAAQDDSGNSHRVDLAYSVVVRWRLSQWLSLKQERHFGADADGPSAGHRKAGFTLLFGRRRGGCAGHWRNRMGSVDLPSVVAAVERPHLGNSGDGARSGYARSGNDHAQFAAT